jgi:integrase
MPRPNRGASLKWVTKRGAFYIVWYEAGRERSRSTGTTDGREAEGILADFIRDRQRKERKGEPKPQHEVTIAEVLDLYGDQHAPTSADPQRIGYAIAALLPFWAERPVSDITKQACRDYVASRTRDVKRKDGDKVVVATVPIADGTTRRELGTLTAALNFAVQEKLLASAPYVELPEKPDGKDRWLTRHEAARLLNAARTGRADVRLYLPLFIVLGLYTGARKEAIASLRWSQVDFGRKRINFAAAVSSAPDKTEKNRRRKTNKRRAHIPIPRRLMTFLRLAHKRRAGDDGFVVQDAGQQVKDIGDSRGGSFGGACSRAGLTGVSPHVLRHTCGTWMAQAGVPLFQIGGWLGHSSEATTRLYAHHSPDFQGEALASFDAPKKR